MPRVQLEIPGKLLVTQVVQSFAKTLDLSFRTSQSDLNECYDDLFVIN